MRVSNDRLNFGTIIFNSLDLFYGRGVIRPVNVLTLGIQRNMIWRHNTGYNNICDNKWTFIQVCTFNSGTSSSTLRPKQRVCRFIQSNAPGKVQPGYYRLNVCPVYVCTIDRSFGDIAPVYLFGSRINSQSPWSNGSACDQISCSALHKLLDFIGAIAGPYRHRILCFSAESRAKQDDGN